jgi:hypothetical protein
VILRRLLAHKIGLKSLQSIESELRVFGKQLRQKKKAAISIFTIHCILIDHYLASLVFEIGLIVVLSFDWIDAKQQHMGNNAKAEQIAFVAVRLFTLSAVFDDFGGHIPHRSTSFVTFASNCFVE